MTMVKICGITNLRDAQLAMEFGADFLGFVFYPSSPRFITQEQVRHIAAQLGYSTKKPKPHLVGVFVDESREHVSRTLDYCGLGYAQLHGAETPEMVSALMKQGLRVIKAFRVQNRSTLKELEGYHATAFLLDTYMPGKPGGTGHTFDWSLAVDAKEFGPVMLAGGFTAENVAYAIADVQPWGIDVSSGVEAEPGKKNPEKLLRLIKAAKSI